MLPGTQWCTINEQAASEVYLQTWQAGQLLVGEAFYQGEGALVQDSSGITLGVSGEACCASALQVWGAEQPAGGCGAWSGEGRFLS